MTAEDTTAPSSPTAGPQAGSHEPAAPVARRIMDGNEAVRVCRNDPPDVVVLDMMLPRRSGFLVLEKIKGHADSPIVLMVTANEGKRHQAYAESLGVDGYMIKPVPLERLIDRTAAELTKIGGPRRRDPEAGDAEQGESGDAGDEGPDDGPGDGTDSGPGDGPDTDD